jgi:hypothetical protein
MLHPPSSLSDLSYPNTSYKITLATQPLLTFGSERKTPFLNPQEVENVAAALSWLDLVLQEVVTLRQATGTASTTTADAFADDVIETAS